jgi:DNA polymerase-3 subunit delta'
VLAGSHPDVHWLAYGEKAPNLEEIRNLRAKNFIRASESDFKVFVIEQADKLNMQSQNALLKVLEEPASSVFILLCENREAMLQTVRSRCKPFRLAPLDPEPLYAALQQQVPDATAPQIQAAMTASQGVMGRALSLLQGDAPKSRLLASEFLQELPKGELAVFAVCQSLGKLSRDEYAAFCDEACLLLCAAAKQSGNWQMISVFEYLKEQRAMLAQNPSPSALAGALSAFCARC